MFVLSGENEEEPQAMRYDSGSGEQMIIRIGDVILYSSSWFTIGYSCIINTRLTNYVFLRSWDFFLDEE